MKHITFFGIILCIVLFASFHFYKMLSFKPSDDFSKISSEVSSSNTGIKLISEKDDNEIKTIISKSLENDMKEIASFIAINSLSEETACF